MVKERDQGAAPVESAVYREDAMNKGMNKCTSLEFCDFQASASSFVSGNKNSASLKGELSEFLILIKSNKTTYRAVSRGVVTSDVMSPHTWDSKRSFLSHVRTQVTKAFY